MRKFAAFGRAFSRPHRRVPRTEHEPPFRFLSRRRDSACQQQNKLDQFVPDVAVDVGQPHIPTRVAIGKVLVSDAQLV